MTRHVRSALLAALAGSACVTAASLARAEAAPAEGSAPAADQSAPDAAPLLALPAAMSEEEGATAGAGMAAGAAQTEVPAVPPVDSGQWQFTIAPYLWMAGVKSSTSFTPANSGRAINANIDASFTDILGDLNFAAMAGAEARRGRFSVQTDAVYMNILQTGSRVRSVTGPRGLEAPVELGSKVKLETTIWTLAGGYDVFRDDRGFVQLFGGFRYLGARSTLNWNFQGPLGELARAGSVKSKADIWNGVAGLRGEHALGDGPWKAIYYVDVGTGGSDLTWQALAQVAYVKRWGDIGLGWRYLEFDQGRDNATEDLRMSGPILTLRVRFGD